MAERRRVFKGNGLTSGTAGAICDRRRMALLRCNRTCAGRSAETRKRD